MCLSRLNLVLPHEQAPDGKQDDSDQEHPYEVQQPGPGGLAGGKCAKRRDNRDCTKQCGDLSEKSQDEPHKNRSSLCCAHNVRAQAGRAKSAEHGSKTEPRPCLQHVC